MGVGKISDHGNSAKRSSYYKNLKSPNYIEILGKELIRLR
jgi:hypothetical protein